MELDDGIAVEDVHVIFELEAFLPTATPRGASRVESKTGPASAQDGSLDAVLGHRGSARGSGEVYEQSACASCVPEVFGRTSEGPVVRSPQHQSPLEIKSDVLRGVRTDVVLRRRATLLSSAAGSEATYLLSSLTDHLGAFISHNWSVSRSKKWLALCVHFNLWTALFCGAMTALLLCVATSLGWLPLAAIEHDYRECEGMYCNVCGFLVFQVVLFFGADFMPARFMRCDEIFLDKVCIHQVDKVLQRQGIESLGGFLYYSWSMVVLYTPVYTKKLWTVYEMACFLSVHPGGRLVWLPADQLPLLVTESLMLFVYLLFYSATTWTSVRAWVVVPSWLLVLTIFPVAVLTTVMLRKTALDQAKSESDLRSFSIKSAVCAVEGDRATVEGNVASLMRDLKIVASKSTHEEALCAFDQLVQNAMPRAVRDSVGRVGLRYEWLLMAQSPLFFSAFDMLGAEVFAGSRVLSVTAVLLYRSILVFASLPLAVTFAMRLCCCCTHLRGFKDSVFLLCVSVTFFLALAIPYVALLQVLVLAREDAVAFALLCVVSVALFSLTYLVFRRPPAQQRRRRTGTPSEPIEELAEAVASHGQRIGAETEG